MRIQNFALSFALLLPSANAALTIASSLSVLEWTPQKIAAEDFASEILGGNITFVNGGVAALTNSSIDLATNAETQALRSFSNNTSLRIIYTISEVAYRLLVDKRQIRSLKELKGKRIGTIPTTSAGYFVQKLLASAGLNSSEYTIVTGSPCNMEPCDNNTLPALLRAGRVDAVGLWEPAIELCARVIGPQNSLFFSDPSVYREIFSLHSTTSKLANPTKRAEIISFIRALEKSLKIFREHPERVYRRVAEAVTPKTEPELLERVWDHHEWPGTIPSDIVDVLVEEDRDYISREQNRTARGRKELGRLVDWGVLREIRREGEENNL